MTPLSYALLGLVLIEPRSGYSLRKVFETTPLGRYSSSPGSIYPALKSLEAARMIEARGQDGSRGKGLYHPTDQGRDALQAWLEAPISDLGEAMLRFAFLADDDSSRTLTFLNSFEEAARAQAAALEAFLDSDAASGMTAKSRMAVEHGRRGFLASAEWAAWARVEVSGTEGESHETNR